MFLACSIPLVNVGCSSPDSVGAGLVSAFIWFSVNIPVVRHEGWLKVEWCWYSDNEQD